MRWQRTLQRTFPAALALGLAATLPTEASSAVASPAAALTALRAASGGPVVTRTAPETGVYGWVRAPDGRVLVRDDASLPPRVRAERFLARFGALVGLSDAQRADVPSVLRFLRADRDLVGGTHVRFEQVYRGLAVYGAQLVVHLDDRGIKGVNGAFVPGIDLEVRPRVDEAAAQAAALAEFPGRGLGVVGSRLVVYRAGLIEGLRGPSVLAWAVNLGEAEVIVDATSGGVINTIPLRPEAKNRFVYTPAFDPAHPGLFLVRREGEPPTHLPPADNLYDFTGHTYDLFWNAFRRDSYDGQGAPMRTVYLVNEACPNAYWDGSTTNYCPAFDIDDVVAHEWGHAYTQYTHGLIYLCQPGALNESYSDIWGETVDLIDGVDGIGGSNNDQPYPAGQRWLIGEDLTERVDALFGLRDMWNPTRRNHPDWIRSTRYVCGREDNGGVHTNSAIPNHAFAMLVDGKTFRNTQVTGIGLVRAAHIYWQAQAYYQTPTSKFADHDQALRAACADLVGFDPPDLRTGLPSGQVIQPEHCQQVAAAMTAVQMSGRPICNFQPILAPNPPAPCAGAQTVFSEDFESGLDGWTLTSTGVFREWPGYTWRVRGALPQGRAGSAAFAVDPQAGACQPTNDVSGRFTLDSPEITLPPGAAQLRFDHYVETQYGWDGGNVAVSVDGGPFSLVPDSAYLYNKPNARLNDLASLDGVSFNPKAGEAAWTGHDPGEVHGSWGTTVVDLSALAQPGQRIRIRFDFGINGCGGFTGWFVDDVRVTVCPPAEPAVQPQ